jgi:hypothetical protein
MTKENVKLEEFNFNTRDEGWRGTRTLKSL